MVAILLALGVWLLIVSLAAFFVVKNMPIEEPVAMKVRQAQPIAQPISDQELVERLSTIVKAYAKKQLKAKKEVKRVQARRKGSKKIKLENLLPFEKAFYFNNPATGEGTFARSLSEFLETLKNAPQEVIYFHLREDMNDFENWVRNVLRDIELADELKRIKEEKGPHKEELVNAIEKRLKARKKMLLKSPIKEPKSPGYL